MTRFKHFEFYNPNPKGNETGDCVVRALTKALNKSWFEVYDEACAVGRELCCMPNDDQTWREILRRHGFERVVLPKTKRGQKALTPEKFCELYPRGVFILRMANHIQAVRHGKWYDLSPDFGDGKIYTYYALTTWEKYLY